ncbi:MAG: alpha/beta hydrolase [Sandaracinaceae bacterium]
MLLDREDLVGSLFFPRPDAGRCAPDAEDHLVPVVGGELHVRHHGVRCGARARTVLLFHGNGEIVSDWDPAAARFASLGWRFAVSDYRGYGRSTGVPTMRRLLEDARVVLAFLRGRTDGPLVVMGRSLGSAAAWEIAADPGVDALVIDSGFTDVAAFARRRGLDPTRLGEEEIEALDPIPKIARLEKPLLLLHGDADRVIAHREAERALAASPAADAQLVTLRGRGHNDVSLDPSYWSALAELLARCGREA